MSKFNIGDRVRVKRGSEYETLRDHEGVVAALREDTPWSVVVTIDPHPDHEDLDNWPFAERELEVIT